MYSQANVRAGKVLRLPIRALSSVIVDTEKVMRESPPGCASKPSRSWRGARRSQAIFLTMKLLEDTPAVLSLGKLCDEHGYSYEWINGQKTTSHLQRYSNTVQYGELRSDRGSWFTSEFFLKLAFFIIHDTFKAGN